MVGQEKKSQGRKKELPKEIGCGGKKDRDRTRPTQSVHGSGTTEGLTPLPWAMGLVDVAELLGAHKKRKGFSGSQQSESRFTLSARSGPNVKKRRHGEKKKKYQKCCPDNGQFEYNGGTVLL